MTRPRLVLGLAAMLACPACDEAPGSEATAYAAPPSSAPVERTDRDTASPATLPQPDTVQAVLDASRRTAIVRAAERAAPAVVSVNVTRRQTVQPRSLWESFFVPRGYERVVQGLGSGFIYDASGLILTNEHVVRGAQEIVVTLADGRDFAAELVGTDDVNDLAVLRIGEPGPDPLPTVDLGTSSDLMIGEWVVAIGNPFGYLLSNPEPTVTAGVVSALGRNIIPSGQDESGYYLDMIQTDASINPGNSGGPLVNARGEVVGVNSSILSRTGGSEGLGFAIPIDRARRVAADLARDGMVRRAWLGVEVEPAEANRFGRSRSVQVARVAKPSPGSEAGLRVGSVIRSVDGEPVRTPLDWEAAVLQARPGEPLVVRTDRGAVRLVPEGLPSLTADRIRALEDFELVTLTPAIRAERGVVAESGALIVSLSGAARDLGLREGDVILQINRQRIRSAEEAAELLGRLSGRGTVVLYYERNRRVGSVSFYIR